MGVIVLARVALDRHWPLPRCAFHAATGLPCFTCGGTRALAALGRLDLSAALSMNPLVTVMVLLAPLWPALAGTRVRAFQPLRAGVSKRWKLALGLLVCAVAANWAFLLRFLPR